MIYHVAEVVRAPQPDENHMSAVNALISEITKPLQQQMYIIADQKLLSQSEEQEEMEEIELRMLPKNEAKKLILDYIEKHPGAWTDEIFMDLKLDPILVFEVLRELERGD